MLSLICLWWIGVQLSAPTWFFVLLGIGFFIDMIDFGTKMYNKGKKDS